jgi:hypothetical protein
MAKYGIYFDAYATTTSAKSAIGLHANGTGEWYEFVEGIMTGSGSATAADRQHRARVAKCTFATAGTGTVITAEPMDDFGRASLILATGEFSAEPTVVGTVFPVLWGFNQRGGMRWAVPQGEGVKVYNANTNKGLVFQVLSDAAGEVDGSTMWWES